MKRSSHFQHTLSPELRLLAALIGRALELPSALPDGCTTIDWNRLWELAVSHRVLPLVHSGLKVSSEIGCPSGMRKQFSQETLRLWQRSQIMSHELLHLSGLLTDANIPMVAMKGPVLTAHAYKPGLIRAMRDLDILIRPADFAQVRTVLEANRFVCEESFRRLTAAQQEFYARSATHISFQHSRLGYILEVHLRSMQMASLLPFSTAEIMADAQPVEVGGGTVQALSPWYHFLYVAAHGAKHGWWRLLWLADFAAFQSRYPQWFSGLTLADAAAEQGALELDRVLGAAFFLSNLCFGPTSENHAGSHSARSREIHYIAAHGIQCLERGCPPRSYSEKWAEYINLWRLRPQAAYHLDLIRLYASLTPDDFACFPLPDQLISCTPFLRPLLWGIRKIHR